MRAPPPARMLDATSISTLTPTPNPHPNPNPPTLVSMSIQCSADAARCADINLSPPRDEKVVQLMAMCDTDKSGMLDRAEFDKFFKIVLRDAAKRASMLGKHDSTSKLAGVIKDPLKRDS